MNTLIPNALKVTCTVMFAIATSGIIPATAYAAKPISSPSSAVQHRNANAYGHGSKQNQVVTEQPANLTSQGAHSSAPLQATTSTSTRTETVPTTKTSNPSGNNGFIKVNEEEIPDSIPNNDPYVSCKLKVEFYNYDQNPTYRANVSFALHNPTVKAGQTMTVVGDTNPFIGEDVAGGGNDLDAAKAYKLTFTGAPHDKQGYHVKLTIHADGSRGADVKHKVFWVQPCEQPGHVLPATTTVTSGKMLSTSTVRSSSTLPSKLPSTGINQLSFMVTAIASALAYVSTMIIQKYRLRQI